MFLKLRYEVKNSKKQVYQNNKYGLITYFKGSVSLLFYHSALDEAVPESEEKMLCALGQLLQLVNDIFDVYKDRQNNIKTLVTDAHQIKIISDKPIIISSKK